MTANVETLCRRAKYGGRKGRRAARRLRAMRYRVTLDESGSPAWSVWADIIADADRATARFVLGAIS